MRDGLLLAWLRWRQWRGSALFWLRSVGYDPNQRSLVDRMYALYLLALGALWVLGMGAWGFSQATAIGARLSPALVQNILRTGLPWVVLAAAIGAMALHLRSTPLKLSFADMSYVAGSPVERWAPVMVNYLQGVVQVLVLLVPALALAAAALAVPLGPGTARWAAARATVVAVPLVALVLAVAWALGLARLAAPRLKRVPLFWLAPLVLVAGGYFVPAVFLWPGRALAAAVAGPAPAPSVAALTLLAVAAIAWLARIGQRTNLVDVADESAVYARINALGLMAWLAPEVVWRIRRQAALARRKPFLRLPPAWGASTLVARSGLAYLRRPLGLLIPAAWGFAVALAGTTLVTRGAGILVWLFGLTLLVLVPPPGLLDAFRSDIREPFLRQFLPADNLRLLLADAAPPLALLVLGALAAWLLQGADPVTATNGALLIVILALVLALGQGASLVVPFWDRRIPYAVWAACGAGSAIAAGLVTHSAGTSTFVGAFAALVIGLAIAASPRITAER